jgi:hypothetical protein
MLTVELMGGLGNQLFQIFTLMAYSKKHNQPFLLEKKESLPGQYVVRNVYWNTLFDKLSHRLFQGGINYPFIREQAFEYNELPPPSISLTNKQANYKLHGYFQSYKYFQDYIHEILNDIGWNEKRSAISGATDKGLKGVEHVERGLKGAEPLTLVSLHFRVGDYVKLQHFHPLMTLKYYTNAIQYIVERDATAKTILYFCEENDIEYVTNTYLNPLKKQFPSLTFVKADGTLEDWKQMILMTTCKHHIIANSSFSWWGAYLAYTSASANGDPSASANGDPSASANKMICYPDKWFGASAGNKNVSDLFPSSWIKCETDIGKHILENVYYINLESRTDRKELVEKELNQLGWKYERFNAIRLKDGRAGCSMSHLKILEMAKERNLEYVVVIEDDIQFTKPAQYNSMLIEFNRFIKQYNIEYDVLLLAGNLRPPIACVSNFIYRISKSWTTTGYIVKRHYYDTMIRNFKEGLTLLMKNAQIKGKYEIDTYWHQLQLKDRWFIFMPRTVTQRPDFSTIENRNTNYNHLMLDR